MSDVEFLNWLADRLGNVYGEYLNADFVIRLRKIAQDDGWIPICTAPKDRTEICIFSPTVGILNRARWRPAKNHWESEYGSCDDATYWRPTLKPPLKRLYYDQPDTQAGGEG